MNSIARSCGSLFGSRTTMWPWTSSIGSSSFKIPRSINRSYSRRVQRLVSNLG
jgi:hypothetical protein